VQHKSYWFAHLTYIMLLHYLGIIADHLSVYVSKPGLHKLL